MKIVAVIPVKPFAQGKSRLNEILPDAERYALNRKMFEHVLSMVTEIIGPGNSVVVSADGEALDLTRSRGATALQEKSDAGLNAALCEGAEKAAYLGGEAVLVLPTDLPTLSKGDVTSLLNHAQTPCVVIAPDRRELGTNALLLSLPQAIDFAFGPDSFAEHREAAQTSNVEPVIVRRDGLAFDVDTPADYRRLIEQDRRQQG